MKKPDNITIRSLVLGALFSGAFALLTVILENRYSMLPTANQLPLFPFVLLAIFVLLLNPLLRLLRFLRPLSLPEMLIIFVMCMVSSGISTFGLTGQLIPIVGGLYNRHWNNDQTEWNRYVDPYLNDNFFIAEPGIQNAARAYADELNRLNDTRAGWRRRHQRNAPPWRRPSTRRPPSSRNGGRPCASWRIWPSPKSRSTAAACPATGAPSPACFSPATTTPAATSDAWDACARDAEPRDSCRRRRRPATAPRS